MKVTIMTGVPGHTYIQPVEVDIKESDRVMLKWYGDRNLPKVLSYTWATVLKCNPHTGSFTIDADGDSYGTRTIYSRHIRKHVPVTEVTGWKNMYDYLVANHEYTGLCDKIKVSLEADEQGFQIKDNGTTDWVFRKEG